MDIDIGFILLQYFCLLFSLCVHEAAHAAMANYCGDPTGRLMGRLTLNPVKHADPLGTVILPLVMMLTNVPYMFGWAKPVPFNPRNLNNARRDPMLIALAGPGSNLLVALSGALVLRILVTVGGFEPDSQIIEILFMIVLYLIMINMILLLFNIIPVPPLDGHYVLGYFLPESGQRTLDQVGPFGILIAIFVARPWLSFALPKMQTALVWFVTWGQTG
ncbi:MAG: site-2 protease family protein [Candidatus Hydrogenedentes bacterium]|nr:site-2 protease family protein [Candidatus Hydrogenedentota bacterium]